MKKSENKNIYRTHWGATEAVKTIWGKVKNKIWSRRRRAGDRSIHEEISITIRFVDYASIFMY